MKATEEASNTFMSKIEITQSRGNDAALVLKQVAKKAKRDGDAITHTVHDPSSLSTTLDKARDSYKTSTTNIETSLKAQKKSAATVLGLTKTLLAKVKKYAEADDLKAINKEVTSYLSSADKHVKKMNKEKEEFLQKAREEAQNMENSIERVEYKTKKVAEQERKVEKSLNKLLK